MVWRGVWGSPFQIRSPSNLGPPDKSGLQGPNFQSLNIQPLNLFQPLIPWIGEGWMRNEGHI